MPPERPRPVPPERPDPANGVFETVRSVDGRVHALPAHLDRLAASVRRLYGTGLGDEPRALLTDRAARLRGERRIRIDAVPEGAGLAFTLSDAPVAHGAPRPVALAPAVLPGGLGGHKWRDRRILDALGADPVPLLVDEDGTVLEAAWANLWVLRGERLVTPPADGRILPGVTRALLLQQAAALGLVADERRIALDELEGADAIVLTSSVRLAVAAGLGAAPAEAPAVTRIRAALATAA